MTERHWAPRLARPPAFHHRNFRLFSISQAVSLIGTWMQNLAQVWLVLVVTRDPLVVGLVTAAQGLPVATLALVGGVVADRVAKRQVLLVTQCVMMILALLLGLLCITGQVAIWQVVLFALALGCANAIDMPTRQAFVVEMVGPSDVGSAVGLNSAIYSAGRLVGPGIAGIVIAGATAATGDAVTATGIAFLANAASFGAVLVGLFMMREAEMFNVERPGGRRSLGAIPRDILDGWVYLRANRSVLLTLLVPGLIAALAVNFNVLVPAYAQAEGLGADVLGLLLAAAGLGALLSALWIGMGGSSGPYVLIGGAILLGASSIALGVIGSPLIWVALLFGAGLGASAMRTSSNAQIQMATPAPLRGRVMSLFTVVFEGASPMGGILAGALAAAGGVRSAFAVTGALALLVALIGGRGILAGHSTPSLPRPRPVP